MNPAQMQFSLNRGASREQFPISSINISEGVLTNMLNPKPVLFVLAFLPQFVGADGPPVWQQIVTLALIFAFTGTLLTMGYGLVAGFAGLALRLGREG